MNNLHKCIMSHQRAHKKVTNILLKDMRNRMAELQSMNLNTKSNLFHEQLYLEQKILNLILISKTAPELSYGIL